MSNEFKKEQSSAAQLNQAFGAKLNATAAVMAGSGTVIPTGLLADRPVNPPDFDLYGATDVEQLQVYIAGTWYVLAQAQGLVAPGPISNFTGSSNLPNAAQLSWNAPSVGNGPFVYGINYRVHGTTAWTSFTNTSSTSVSVTGLQAATVYDFQVVTTGALAPPSTSTTIQVTTKAVAPSAPTGVTVGTATSTTLEVSWNTPSSGTPPLSYVVKATAGSSTITSPEVSQTSYTLTGLAANTTYAITVTASNSGGSATSSPAANGTTSAAAGSPPAAPTNLTATEIGTNAFTLGWTGSGVSGVSYQPEWAAVSGSVSGVVREPYNQPGSAQSVWNTPIGSGATFSNTSDTDQVALTSKSCTILYGTNGVPVTIGQSSDPLITISSPTNTPATTRTWYYNPGGDGTFWVSPFETTANWITSGADVNAIRNGVNATPTGIMNLPGGWSQPVYIGTASDPVGTVTDGSKTIQVHLPLGAAYEQPGDFGIGGLETTRPYQMWCIGVSSMTDANGNSITAVTGPGWKITGVNMDVSDGSGQLYMDIVTGQPGSENAYGQLQEYDLQQALADDNYVVQHMLAYELDPRVITSNTPPGYNGNPVWPLKIYDNSHSNTGSLYQGLTVGIPANVPYPSNKVGNRAFKLLWDNAQQYGWFFYNVADNGAITLMAYPLSSATQTFAQQLAGEMNDIAAYLCILDYTIGQAGAQYSVDTQKGKLPGQPSNPAFPPPAPLDLSPTNGVNISPSQFGAWYPSGYNVTPNNTPPSSGSPQTQRDNGLTAQVHFPTSAKLGPNGTFTLFDMTQPNKIWAGTGCTFNNGTDPSGGITCTNLETDLTCQSMEDATTGNYGYDQGIGLIRDYDLTQGAIEHTIRWLGDPSLMNPSPAGWNQGIVWPDTHAIDNKAGYAGSIQPGATIAIPPSVNLNSIGLTEGGLMLAKCLQQFGAIWRGSLTGGVTFTAEQNISSQNLVLLQQMQQDCPKLLPLLRIMRNQSASSKNGGGTPLSPLPLPLDVGVCPGSSGGGSGGVPTTFSPIGQPTTGSSASITGLQPDTTYAFEVAASNSAGSATSNVLYVTTAVSGSSGGGGGPATPTTTWDPAGVGGPITLSSDKLTAFSGGSSGTPQGVRSTSGKTTGMFWFEVTASTITTDFAIGIVNTSFDLASAGGLGSDANGIGYYPVSPAEAVYYNGAGLTWGGGETDSSGATFTVVVDIDGQQLWVTSPAMRATVGSGAWNNSFNADPATKSGGLSFSGLSGTKYICFNVLENGAAAVLNTGFSPPSITIPSGVQPWDPGTGGGGGTGSTGKPTMTGPASVSTPAKAPVGVVGIQIADSSATGTCTLAMACSKGTLTATIGGSPVAGSGTSSISYSNTLANCQTVAGNLVYTAGASTGSDNIGITFTDNLGQSVTIHTNVTITASTAAQLLPSGPLSALGAQIVDQNNNPVRICATNWDWYGGKGTIPAGLDTLSYKTVFGSLVAAGINTVRIGVAMASVNRDDPFPIASGGGATGTGKFYVANGQIIAPDGSQFIAAGLNVDTNTNADQVTNLFPGINFVRFPCGSYVSPSSIASFVKGFTDKKIVVEIEYHPWPLINAQSGSALTAETNWYTSLANFFKGNPYVWFGSMNEPQGGDITAEQVAVYNSIRGTGNDTIIMMECGAGAGVPNMVGAGYLNAPSYASMTGIVWDFHFYGWIDQYNPDLTALHNAYLGSVASSSGLLGAQGIQSADGVVPVLNGEFGPATDGTKGIDANAAQVEATVGTWAVQNGYSAGFAGWHWDADPYNAVQSGGVLNTWGQNLAGYIAAVAQSHAAAAPSSTGINYTLNPDLQGLNFNEAMKTVINYGKTVGLRFIVAFQSCEGSNSVNDGSSPPNGLWYDTGGASNGTDGGGNTGTINQTTYTSLCTKIATMFNGNDALIGIDLLNGPTFNATPGCSWGAYTPSTGRVGVVGSNTDLRAAYQAGGNAALAANPNLLIFCNGPIDTGTGSAYAPEGALQAIHSWPVTLNKVNKLVYGASVYPNEVSGANPDNGASWVTRMNTEWGWLFTNNQGPPVWVSECGDNMRTSDGQTYATGLISYLNGHASGGPAFTADQQGVSWSWTGLQVINTSATPGFGILSGGGGGVDAQQQAEWDQMLFVSNSGTAGPPLIQAPLSGTVQTGQWNYANFTAASMPNGYMHYAYLLPHGYSEANRYPVLVYLHANTEGNNWYYNQGDPTTNTIVNQDVIDGTFNTVAFRRDHPCIVIVPYCDQTDGLSGTGLNWGGYNDVPGQNVNENAVVGIVQSFWATYSCYPAKTYVTGDSLGGFGTIAQMLDYNRVNGPEGLIWTAGLCLSGGIVRSPNPVQTPSIMTRMETVPLFCVAGSGDDTDSSGANNNYYERPAWQYFTGNTNYPAPPGVMGGSVAGCQAGSTLYHYGEDTTLGHDTWSGNASGHNYRLYPNDGSPFYDWLFSQEVA